MCFYFFDYLLFNEVNDHSFSNTDYFIFLYLRLNQWVIETTKLNICSIRILICNTDDEMQTLQLINVYNSYLLFFTSTKKSSIIFHLNKLFKDDCKQLIIRNFNLHYFHWKRWRCFTWYTAINTLLNIIISAKLKLLLKLRIVTCKTHNQFTMIDLVFSSEKLQFMTCKCKICIDLHQRSNYFQSSLSYVCKQLEYNSQLVDYERKWTQKRWMHICEYIFIWIILWTARQWWTIECAKSSRCYKRLSRNLLFWKDFWNSDCS